MLVFEERRKPEYLEKKPLRANERINNKLNSQMLKVQASPTRLEGAPRWHTSTKTTLVYLTEQSVLMGW